MAHVTKKNFKLSFEHEELLRKYAKRLKMELDELQKPDEVAVEIATSILRDIVSDESHHE